MKKEKKNETFWFCLLEFIEAATLKFLNLHSGFEKAFVYEKPWRMDWLS